MKDIVEVRGNNMLSLFVFTFYYKLLKRYNKVKVNLMTVVLPLILDYFLMRSFIDIFAGVV